MAEATPAPAPAPAATPDPAPSPAPAPKATPLAGDPTPPTPPAPPKFPDDWRAHLAGEDKAALKDLEKYTDPNALYKSLRDVQAKISKGELKPVAQPLPANANDEQKAAWRKANDLPETAAAYVEKLALPDGVVVGEADKQLVGDFAKLAYDKGWSQAQLNDAVSWFYQAQEVVEAQRAEVDNDHKMTAAQELTTEWGADYKANMNAVGTLLSAMPDEFRAEVLTARTADGRMLGNSAAFNKWAAQMARELNPSATLVAPGTPDAAKSIASEIAEIEKGVYDAHGNPNRDYWTGDAGAAKQARYRELVDAQQRMKDRGRAA